MAQNAKHIYGPPEVRFEAKFVPEPNTGCWLWFGALITDGYGSLRIDATSTMKAHRFSWQHYVGPILGDLQVLHACDVRCCVNPEHLFLGSNADNVADRVAKGRSGSVSGPANHNYVDGSSSLRGTIGQARGEMFSTAKLTEADVVSIRLDERPQRSIAADYSVSQTLISQVKLRKIWQHVD